MKLLLLPPYFTPERQSSSLIDHHRYEAFADAGFEMLLYTPIPTRGIDDEIREEYRKRTWEKMYNGMMTVVRYPLMKEGKNPIGRAIRYFLGFTRQYMAGSKHKDADCIFLVSTPPIQGLLGGLLKKRLNIPFVYNLQDIFPDSLVGSGLSTKGSLLWKIGRIIENYTYSNADKIVVISEDFKRNIMSKGVAEEKIEVIYNWVDEKAIVPVAKEENPLYDELEICKDKFNVVYAGNLGNAQNIDIIINAAQKLLSNQEINFLIFGSGGLKEQYVNKVHALGIKNVRFFPLQPIERVSQVYGLGDVCVVSCKPGLGGAAMPSKMVSIMSAGRAVAASFDEGEVTYLLKHYNCGKCAPAGDVDAFAEMILSLSANRETCKQMGQNSRQLVLDRFTRKVGTQRYVNVIKEVVVKSKAGTQNRVSKEV